MSRPFPKTAKSEAGDGGLAGVFRNRAYWVISGARDLRRFRSAILSQAIYLAEHPKMQGLLVLVEPQITTRGLATAWEEMSRLLKDELFGRMGLIRVNKGTSEMTAEWLQEPSIPARRNKSVSREHAPLSAAETTEVSVVVANAGQSDRASVQRPAEAFFDVLRILMVQWVRKQGPITSMKLAEHAGVSYATVAESLKRLGAQVKRSSDRRVELDGFPKTAWFQLLAQMEKVRNTRYFSFPEKADRETAMKHFTARLQESGKSHLAIGGVLGARHYMPGLDLIGTPRLDLVVQAGGKESIEALLYKISPACKPASEATANLAIHTLYRHASFFQRGPDGTLWADEVECLLDLHEAHLEAQALEFLEYLNPLI